MGFREHLQEMVDNLEGAVAASVIGLDGIAIDTIETGIEDAAAEVDIQTLLVEYTNILSQLTQATELLETGAVTELSVNTDRLVTLTRALTDEYVAVVAFIPQANYGKARYRLRLAASKLKEEL